MTNDEIQTRFDEIYHIIKWYLNRRPDHKEIMELFGSLDDLVQEVVFETLNTKRADKDVAFSTEVVTRTRWVISKKRRNVDRWITNNPLKSEVYYEKFYEGSLVEAVLIDIERHADKARQHSERNLQFFKKYYIDGLTHREIAKKYLEKHPSVLSLTHQRVCQILEKYLEHLKRCSARLEMRHWVS